MILRLSDYAVLFSLQRFSECVQEGVDKRGVPTRRNRVEFDLLGLPVITSILYLAFIYTILFSRSCQ